LIVLAKTLRRLEKEASQMGYRELALIIGTAALVAQDSFQDVNKSR